MKTLPTDPPAPRTDRHSTTLLHDEPNVRVIAFSLQPGQAVPEHRSDATVVVHVVAGAGLFRGEDGEARLEAGMSAVYAPGEMHSMEAAEGALHFHAIITPSPS